ncbi:MAG TPA: hypothetical protein VG168_01930 [Bryobacteraceae bacterium]|nr:hypothetical protein [Bryobacteraceae bacterium]
MTPLLWTHEILLDKYACSREYDCGRVHGFCGRTDNERRAADLGVRHRSINDRPAKSGSAATRAGSNTVAPSGKHDRVHPGTN